MYSPFNYEENVSKGYLVKTKDPFIGFICVFGFGPLGALYYGGKHSLEMFGYYFACLICFACGVIAPFFHIGTMIFGFAVIAKKLSLVFLKENSYKLTPEGEILQKEYDLKQSQEIKADVEAVKAKAGNFLKNVSEKLTKSECQPVQALPKEIMSGTSITQSFCQECGVKHSQSAKFCPACGIKIEKAA